MQRNPKRENIKVMLFSSLCMQMDRKIIAVIADSFSPKTEWPWGIRVWEKSPLKLHSYPDPTCLAGYGFSQGHLPFLCLVSFNVEKDICLFTEKVNESQRHPKLIRKKCYKTTKWYYYYWIVYADGMSHFAAKMHKQFQVWWRTWDSKSQAQYS